MISHIIKLEAQPQRIAFVCLIILLVQARLGIAVGTAPVREAQALLTELSYSPGPIDGILGPQTLRALHDFQRDNGLPLTDNVDAKTVRLLQAASEGLRITAGAIDATALVPNSPVHRGSDVTKTAAGSAAPSTPGGPLDSEGSVHKLAVIRTAGHALGLFVLAVATALLALGLMFGLLVLMRLLSEASWPLIRRRARSLVVTQLAVCQNTLQKSGVWQWLTRSLVGRTPAVPFTRITSSKPIEVARRWLRSLIYRVLESRLWQKLTESARYWCGKGVLRHLKSLQVRYLPSSDLARNVPGSTPRHYMHHWGDINAAPLAVKDRASMEGLRRPLPADANPLHETSASSAAGAAIGEHSETGALEKGLHVPLDENGNDLMQTGQSASHNNRDSDFTPRFATRVQRRNLIGDPLASLSVQLAFERFDEAEELAKNAVERYPDRHEYRLRLLQVYHETGNRIGFEYHARALSAAVGCESPMMAIVADWWRDLAPNEPLFSAVENQPDNSDEPVAREQQDDRSNPEGEK